MNVFEHAVERAKRKEHLKKAYKRVPAKAIEDLEYKYSLPTLEGTAHQIFSARQIRYLLIKLAERKGAESGPLHRVTEAWRLLEAWTRFVGPG